MKPYSKYEQNTKITDVEKQNAIILLIIIKHEYGTNKRLRFVEEKLKLQMYKCTVQLFKFNQMVTVKSPLNKAKARIKASANCINVM